ncbi:uncharacterized protein LOC112554660 isoform X2 [Pomacea canaliculata]|uniref:uncharacterized protein LOC112554660 isoform X2 n=1 Tax=Pomacea canaliculata TaxID=400727 RepID=UPI000D73A229|nr:uncharacterized protein LOC112554660 isoform X2 [Pomacea canaliculata]
MDGLTPLLLIALAMVTLTSTLNLKRYRREETPIEDLMNDERNADVYDRCLPRSICRNGGYCQSGRDLNSAYAQNFTHCVCNDPIFTGKHCEIVRNCPGYIWKWAFLKEGDVEDPFKEGNYTDEQKLTLIEKEFYRFILIHFPDSFPNMSSPDPPTLYDWGFEVIECRKATMLMFLKALLSANKSVLSPKLQVRYLTLHYILTTYIENMEKWKYFVGITRLSNYEGFFLHDMHYVLHKMQRHWTKWTNHTIILTFNLLQSMVLNVTYTLKHAMKRKIATSLYSIYLLPKIFDELMTPAEIYKIKSLLRAYDGSSPDGFYDNLLVHPLERYPVTKILPKARRALGYQMSAMKSFLKHVYWKNLRPSPSVVSLPDGKEFYIACLEWYLGEPSPDPDRIMDHAEWEVLKISEAVEEMMEADFFDYEMTTYFQKLKREVTPISTGEIVTEMHRLLNEVIKPKLSKVMDVELPPNPKIVLLKHWWDRTFYDRGTLYINPRNAFRHRLLPMAMRYGIPGEHFRFATLLNRTDVPEYLKWPVLKRGAVPTIPQTPFPAFHWGWGAYAEALSLEMGLQRSKLNRLAFYAERMLRATAAAVDVGIHWKKWSRSTAASYLYDHNSFPEEFLAQVLDSAISLPGEATAALMGQSKLQDLRQIAEMEYESKFNLKKFHKKVLDVIPGLQISLTSVIRDPW